MSLSVAAKPARNQRLVYRENKIDRELLEPIFLTVDLCLIVLASILSVVIYLIGRAEPVANLETYAGLGLVAGLVYVAGARRLGLYHLQDLLRQRSDNRRVLQNWCFSVLLLAVLLFVLKIGSSISRL